MTTVPKETEIALSRRGLLVCAVAGLAAIPHAAAAQERRVVMQVIDRETGRPARVWRQAGRTYVAGRPGARYGIRVTNNSPSRVMAVVSVDGVNVVTGQTAAYDQPGYVFEPFQSYEVTGWRKSSSEVAAFSFSPQSRSYAARTGRPGDVGVIGLAVFAERAPAPVAIAPAARETESAGRARLQSAAPAAAPAEKLGTGHGKREWSSATEVAFERATPYPQFVTRIEYDSFENLVAAGVIPRPRLAPSRPRPFPGGQRYVPDPPDWR